MRVQTPPRIGVYPGIQPHRIPSTSLRSLTRPPADPMEEPEKWGRILATAIVDTVEGRRDVRTLARWLSTTLFKRLASQLEVQEVPANPKPAKAHSARAYRVSPDSAEVAVTLWDRDRLRAVALHMERNRGRWIVTAAEFA